MAAASSPAPGRIARLRRRLGLGRPAAAPRPAPPRGRAGAGPRLLYVGPDDAALADLAARLEETLPDLDLLAALPEADGAPPRDPSGHAPAAAPPAAPPAAALPTVARPAEPGRRGAARWLQELRPDLVLWHGPLADDPVLGAITESGRRAVAVDVPAPAPPARRVVRSALAAMHRTLARDAEAARALREIGPPGARIEIAGRFVALREPPRCDATERDHLAQVLEARPVWLAVDPGAAEIAALLEAHRTALQGAHRLLLVVVPAADEDGPGLARFLREQGWRVARRGAEGEPDDATEIFVADSREELGLWYRLAPLTCLGGTLAGGAVPDAAGPASLGSALIAGPHGGERAAFLDRLESAGGLHRLARPGDLGGAVATLLAPDRAAALAHAAWDVASDGARVRERVVAALRDALRAGDG
jgi:3-deoxy-D-manno-octulosonic-acid transferase